MPPTAPPPTKPSPTPSKPTFPPPTHPTTPPAPAKPGNIAAAKIRGLASLPDNWFERGACVAPSPDGPEWLAAKFEAEYPQNYPTPAIGATPESDSRGCRYCQPHNRGQHLRPDRVQPHRPHCRPVRAQPGRTGIQRGNGHLPEVGQSAPRPRPAKRLFTPPPLTGDPNY